MVEIVPAPALQILPFKPEPLSAWNQQTDLQDFLYALFDLPGESIDSDGRHVATNFRDYGKDVYLRGIQNLNAWVPRFEASPRSIGPAAGSAIQTIEVPDFLSDPEFGEAGKYLVAWDGVASAVLEESAFFSLPHVLETESNLDCSMLLASNLYYSYASQVLRGFLENL